MYSANPDALADELEQLLEPHSDAMNAVLHNRIIDIITQMCGEEEMINVGNEFVKDETHMVLKCKHELAKSLAMSVIRRAR